MCLAHGSHVQLWWQILTGRQSHFFFKAPRKSGWLNASAFSKTTGLGAQLSVWKVFFSSVSELFSLNWTSAHLPETSLTLWQPRKFSGRKLKRFDPSHLCPGWSPDQQKHLSLNFSFPQSSSGDVINPHTGQGFKAGLKHRIILFWQLCKVFGEFLKETSEDIRVWVEEQVDNSESTMPVSTPQVTSERRNSFYKSFYASTFSTCE